MSRILMVASEATPFAKTGGLADVIGSLPAALQKLGHVVAVLMPRYRSIPRAGTTSVYDNLHVTVGSREFTLQIRGAVAGGVQYFFVEHDELFDREGHYTWRGHDYADNHIRFAAFSQAALAAARTFFPCDILHCHDWQSALVPVYRAAHYHADPALVDVRTLLTIHNLGYQGRFNRYTLPELGLNWGWFSMERLEFYGDINLLKGGIVMADALSTVSPTYAQEIQTPEGGFGLDGVLRTRAGQLTGILNGADYEEWNPATDAFLAANYSTKDLRGKRACKRDVLQAFGLPDDNPDRPLVGIVSRFADQKGFDILAGLGHEFAGADVQLVVLGSGERRYEQLFRDWQAWLPGKVSARVGFHNQLAHKVEAGADLFLMPSRYEPCGLNQIYSLRYGTPPVVRATGGLADTVNDDTGFVFPDYSAESLTGAFRAALEAYQDRPAWEERMRRGMAQDFSWASSARAYSRLYEELAGGAL